MSDIHPRLKELLEREAELPAPPIDELTPAHVRADELAVLRWQSGPVVLHSVDDVVVSRTKELTARLYRPAPGPLPTMIYFHGGGFVIDAVGYDRPLRELALATSCLIFAPNVRLAPEHHFPVPPDDALLCARWACARAKTFAGAAGPIGIAGDSSGGNLAAVTTRRLSLSDVPVDFQILIYPMLDATASSPSYRRFATGFGFSRAKSLWYFDQYLPPGADREHPRVSPLSGRDFTNLPPTLVITAELDPLCDDGTRYARAIENAGGDATVRCYDGMIHGFFQLTGLVSAAHQVQTDISDWLRGRVLSR